MPKVAQQALTELSVRKAKPADKRYDLFDASVRGLGLNFVPFAGHWGTLPQSVKGAPNGTTSTQLYRRL